MKEKIYRFMQGRYGNDQFNNFLLALAVISCLLSMFGVPFFYLVGMVLLIYIYFRMFSRNIYKRRAENSAYLTRVYKIKQKFSTWKRDMKQRKTHHIYKCPSCKQKLRIPKGRGKIEIRCPKCGHTFIKKS